MSKLLVRIERTMAGRACEGLPPAEWVAQLRQTLVQEPEEIFIRHGELFKALSDPMRLKILKLLAEKGELCVCEVQAALNQIQSLTSHHLNVLRRAGIVKTSKKGRWVYYGLNEGMAKLLEESRQILR